MAQQLRPSPRFIVQDSSNWVPVLLSRLREIVNGGNQESISVFTEMVTGKKYEGNQVISSGNSAGAGRRTIKKAILVAAIRGLGTEKVAENIQNYYIKNLNKKTLTVFSRIGNLNSPQPFYVSTNETLILDKYSVPVLYIEVLKEHIPMLLIRALAGTKLPKWYFRIRKVPMLPQTVEGKEAKEVMGKTLLNAEKTGIPVIPVTEMHAEIIPINEFMLKHEHYVEIYDEYFYDERKKKLESRTQVGEIFS